MIQYIQPSGLLNDLDYDIERIIFSDGVPINETVDEWNVAITGGAAVYLLAN